MKIRNGFVSNSSSCSFCIYGAVFDPECVKITYGDVENFNNKIDEHLIYADLYNIYVGISLKDMYEDEKFYEFKQRVQELMNAFCDEYKVDRITCDVIERAWHD